MTRTNTGQSNKKKKKNYVNKYTQCVLYLKGSSKIRQHKAHEEVLLAEGTGEHHEGTFVTPKHCGDEGRLAGGGANLWWKESN